MQQLTSTGYDGKKWLLIDQVTQRSVRQGDIRVSFKGDACVIMGGSAPHKPSSTGRVHTAQGREFFPSVFGCVWTRV